MLRQDVRNVATLHQDVRNVATQVRTHRTHRTQNIRRLRQDATPADQTQDPFWLMKVAIHEMMLRFCGHSAHTVKIKNKAIKQDYKVFALCSHGYTYAFLWYSLLHGTANLIKLDHLTLTASAVYQLTRMLPGEYCWNLVLDNYFTSIPLFEELGKIGIGAGATTRVHSRGFPSCLKIEKSEARKALP